MLKDTKSSNKKKVLCYVLSILLWIFVLSIVAFFLLKVKNLIQNDTKDNINTSVNKPIPPDIYPEMDVRIWVKSWTTIEYMESLLQMTWISLDDFVSVAQRIWEIPNDAIWMKFKPHEWITFEERKDLIQMLKELDIVYYAE